MNTVTRVAPDKPEGEQRSPGVTTTSAYGYEPPWTGTVEVQLSAHDLHALIIVPMSARGPNL